MTMPPQDHPPRTWLGGLGIVVLAAGWSLGSGLPGLLATAGVALCWYTLPVQYTFTIGQFALVALVSQSPATASVVIAGGELGLVAMLCEPVLAAGLPRSRWLPVGVVGGSSLVAVGGGWLSVHWLGGVWQAVALLSGVVLVVTYGLHRYERFVLELPAELTAKDHE